jgi:hypothetical protein
MCDQELVVSILWIVSLSLALGLIREVIQLDILYFIQVKQMKLDTLFLERETRKLDFNELKPSCKNVHFIRMKDGKFVWRDSNCNIHIISKYIDITKCEPYDDRRITEHSDTAMFLTAEPGMGKSTLLSYMEHEIKKCNPAT